VSFKFNITELGAREPTWLETDEEQDLHYSSAVTLSRDDAFKIREILLSAIKNSVDHIVKSPEEDVFALIVDFIGLSQK
jgi:hypothetical protein